jgi:phage terminase small subunit
MVRRRRTDEGVAFNPASFNTDGSLIDQQHERLCREYVANFNQTAAYIAAGYKPANRGQARMNASLVFADQNIQARIRALTESTRDRLEVEATAIAQKYKAIAFAEMGEFFDDKGNPLSIEKVPKMSRHAIKKWKISHRTVEIAGEPITDVTTDIELHDPKSALDKLALYCGLDKNALIVAAEQQGLTIMEASDWNEPDE